MYQKSHGQASGCLLLLLDLIIIAYFAAYILTPTMPHNAIVEFLIEGMKKGMR